MTATVLSDSSQSPAMRPTGLIMLAGIVLAWERLWLALWLPFAIVGAFFALVLFGLPQSLPGGLHAVLLAGTGLASAVTAWRGLRGFVVPDALEARRRLERDSGLAHRPLNALDDRAAGTDETAAALWRLHQQRVAASLGHLRVGLPRPGVVDRDPFALRVLVLLVLMLALVGSWGEWERRLVAGVTPHFTSLTAAPPPALDVWVTPPEYTGLPPVFLQTGNRATTPAAKDVAAVAVPFGSVLMARLSGGKEVPKLEVEGGDQSFETVEAGTYQVRHRIEGGSRIAVLRQGDIVAQWPITVIPDRPPTISFAEDPLPGANGALRIAFTAGDDYGVNTVALSVRRDGGDTVPGDTISIPLPLAGSKPREVSQATVQDLTPHPWAGLPVVLTLTASDGAGQTTRSAEVRLLLPERHFNNQVARDVIAVRKDLVRSGSDGRVASARRLLEIGARPDAFAGDTVVVLALRSAAGRLLMDRDPAAVPAVIQLLWDTALRIEDGLLSIAERDLRDAQNNLRQALDSNAGDEEISRLMDELQQALDQYMNALDAQLKQALQRGESLPDIPPELADRLGATDPTEVQSMLDRMRALAETGSRDAARQMLAQIQQMLENMRMGTLSPDQRNQQDETWSQLREIKDLAARQQQLLDEAFQASQSTDLLRGRGGDGRAASPSMQAQADRQERLRRDLNDLIRRLGEGGTEPPAALARAERAMRGAVQALRRGQPGNAVPRETQSVDELQQGIRAFAETALQRMMEMGGMPGGMPAAGAGRMPGRDPLGRRATGSGPIDSGDVRIPEEADIQKAREILDELRRRSGEFSRPKGERDYIERLLRQF